MSLSAKEAAELVGMSKPGIIKAIRQGKLSAEKDIKGEWRIEPVELFRVYEPVGSSTHQPVDESLRQHTPDLMSLQAELEQLRQRLADKDDVIQDLRQRLDSEADERRKLTLILTEVRREVHSKPEEPRKLRSWWTRLLGGRE